MRKTCEEALARHGIVLERATSRKEWDRLKMTCRGRIIGRASWCGGWSISLSGLVDCSGHMSGGIDRVALGACQFCGGPRPPLQLKPFWEPVGKLPGCSELVLAVATYRLHGDGTASAHVGGWSLGPGPADEVRAEVERIVREAMDG